MVQFSSGAHQFTCCHGQREIGPNGQTFKGFSVRDENNGQKDIMITPSDISNARGNNEYELVFLDSCWSALSGGELFKDAFKSKIYLGWAIDTTSYEWAPVSFFRNCVTSEVQKALDDTIDEGRKKGAFPEEKYELKILGNGVGVDINLNHKKQ